MAGRLSREFLFSFAFAAQGVRKEREGRVEASDA